MALLFADFAFNPQGIIAWLVIGLVSGAGGFVSGMTGNLVGPGPRVVRHDRFKARDAQRKTDRRPGSPVQSSRRR